VSEDEVDAVIEQDRHHKVHPKIAFETGFEMRAIRPYMVPSLAIAALLLFSIVPLYSSVAQQAAYRSAHFALTVPAGHDVTRLLDELERAYDEIRSFGLGLPGMVRVRSYGSTSEFVRRSRGHSFHLALAEGDRLHLQPLAVLLKNGALARTLRHELAHVGLAGAARRGLPRWLNEGVAMVAAGESHPETIAFTSLRQLDDTLARSRSHDNIRSAYGTSVRLARGLIDRHGRGKVLALLRTIGARGNFERTFRAATGATLKEWEKSELGRR